MPELDDEKAGLPAFLKAQPTDDPSLDYRPVGGRDPLEEAPVPLSRTETFSLREADHAAIAAERRKRAESVLDNVGSTKSSFWLMTRAGRAILTGLAAIGAVLCCLFAFSQVVQLLVSIQALPTLPRYAGYSLLSILVLMLVFVFARLALAVMRLRQNRQLSLSHLRALDARQELRELARERRQTATNELRLWLKEYPLDDSHRQFLGLCGVSKVEVDQLTKVRKDLLVERQLGGSDSWISKFVEQFQSQLDAAADRVVRDYMESVALKTAVSPNPLIDTVVVIYSGFGMLTSLCLIYNLRVSWLSLLRFAGLVFTQAYLAGRLEELPVEDWLSDAINKALSTVSKANIPFLGNFVGSLAGPGIQGVANGMLIRRLGRHASRLLRPIAVP